MSYATHATPLYTPGVTVSFLRVYENCGFIFNKAQVAKACPRPPIQPARKYLAEKSECSQTTVSRATTWAAKHGFLTKVQPRNRDGTWRPAVYRLAADAVERLRFALKRAARVLHRVSKPAHITKGINNSSGNSESRGPGPERMSLKSTLAAIRGAQAAGKIKPDSPPPAGLFGRGE